MENYARYGRLAGVLLIVSTIFSAVQMVIANSVIKMDATGFLMSILPSAVNWVVMCLLAIGLLTDRINLARVPAIVLLVLSALSLSILVIGRSERILLLSGGFSFLIYLLLTIGLFSKGKWARVICLMALVLRLAQYFLPQIRPLLERGQQPTPLEPDMVTLAGAGSLLFTLAGFFFLGLYLAGRSGRVSGGDHFSD